MPILEWMPPRTDLAATLAPLRRGNDPTQQRAVTRADERVALWRTAWFAAGPATLRIAQCVDGQLRDEAWGAGADAALAQAPELAGVRDNVRAFPAGTLAAAHRRRAMVRIPRTGQVFAALVPAVLEQRVIATQAQLSWRRLVLRFGETPPGPAPAGMRLAPRSHAWARIPSWEWHRAGVDLRRARIITQLAPRAAAIDRLAGLPAAQARAQLQRLPGIGPWTAAETAQRALGDADAVSVGDFHLAKHIGYALAGRDFDDAEMLRALQPWTGHRFRAVQLILASGPRRPKYGPKLAYVDYRSF